MIKDWQNKLLLCPLSTALKQALEQRGIAVEDVDNALADLGEIIYYTTDGQSYRVWPYNQHAASVCMFIRAVDDPDLAGLPRKRVYHYTEPTRLPD